MNSCPQEEDNPEENIVHMGMATKGEKTSMRPNEWQYTSAVIGSKKILLAQLVNFASNCATTIKSLDNLG